MAKFMVIFALALVAAVSAQDDGIISPTDAPTAPTEATTAPTDAPTAPTEATTPPTEATTPPTEAPTAPTEAPTAPTEAPTAPTEAPTAPTEAPTAPTEAPTAPTEAPTAPTEAPTAPTEAPTAPTEAPTAAPTNTPTDAPTTTPKPTRGKTWQEIRDMCKNAHANDQKADVLINDTTCQGSCASIERFPIFWYLFEFTLIRKYNDPPVDLADGQPCKKNGMCLNGKCYENSIAKPCMNTTSPVTKVTKNDCSVTCNLEDGQTQMVPINDSGACGFFGQCKGGKCRNSWFRK